MFIRYISCMENDLIKTQQFFIFFLFIICALVQNVPVSGIEISDTLNNFSKYEKKKQQQKTIYDRKSLSIGILLHHTQKSKM